MSMRRIAAFAVILAAQPGFAQLPKPTPVPLVGARSLALSPDGKQLAFSFQGDIWTVDAAGGRAVRLTNHIEMDDNPVWSPDGTWIAFSSNRYGNNEIFVIPSEGGAAKRLTWNSGSDVPSDWSPDGKTILFSGRRDTAENGLFSIDVLTGRLNLLMQDMMSIGSPKFAADGKSVLYTRFGFPWYRPRYQGSAASQLWRYDLASKKRIEVRNNGFQHLWASFDPNGKGVVAVTVTDKTPSSSFVGKPIPKFVDSPTRTPNVYAIDGPSKARRLTSFVGYNVRFLTVARNAEVAAFENDGAINVMALDGKPAPIKVYAAIDDKTTQEERLVLTSGVSDLSLSPDNKTFAFTVRGEIWTIPIEKGKGPNADDATQMTDWEGSDTQPIWTPDGKFLFFASDRDGACASTAWRSPPRP